MNRSLRWAQAFLSAAPRLNICIQILSCLSSGRDRAPSYALYGVLLLSDAKNTRQNAAPECFTACRMQRAFIDSIACTSARAAVTEIRLKNSLSGMSIVHMVHTFTVLIFSCTVESERGDLLPHQKAECQTDSES